MSGTMINLIIQIVAGIAGGHAAGAGTSNLTSTSGLSATQSLEPLAASVSGNFSEC